MLIYKAGFTILLIALTFGNFKYVRSQFGRDTLLSEEGDLNKFLMEKCQDQLMMRPVVSFNQVVEVDTAFTGHKFRDIDDGSQQYVPSFTSTCFQFENVF